MNTVQDKLEQIKADIASEKLTYPQIREKLETLIEHEYSKEGGPDVDLVIACEDLLWRLGTDNAPFVTHEDQYKEAIRSRIEASHRTRQIKKPVLRFVAALVVVVLLLGGAEVFLHREWLEQTDTEDQQQHIVQGFTVDPELVAKTIAAENGFGKINTANYQDVKNFLGFDLPECIFLNGWTIREYVISIRPIYIRVFIQYENIDNQYMSLDIRMFSDIENAFLSFEQTQKGKTEVINNTNIYCFQNINDNSILWQEELVLYLLNSNVSMENAKSIAALIIGGKDE